MGEVVTDVRGRRHADLQRGGVAPGPLGGGVQDLARAHLALVPLAVEVGAEAADRRHLRDARDQARRHREADAVRGPVPGLADVDLEALDPRELGRGTPPERERRGHDHEDHQPDDDGSDLLHVVSPTGTERGRRRKVPAEHPRTAGAS